MTVIWLPAPGWQAYYEISNDGRVRNGERELKQRLNKQGYPMVQLSRPRFSHRVHRLVASAFVANPDKKPNVNHIDNNPSNNNWENLEWCTQRENLEHMTNQGRRARPNLGVQPSNASMTDDDVRRCIILRQQGLSFGKIASAIGSSKRSAMRVCHGVSYASALKRIGLFS